MKFKKQTLEKQEKQEENEENYENNENDFNSQTEQDEENNDSDNIDDLKKKTKTKETKNNRNLGAIASSLLVNPKKSLPSKRNKQEEKVQKAKEDLFLKRKLKKKQRKNGYFPNILDWGKDEKAYRTVATNGVVQLFNAIYDIKKKIIEENKQEAIIREKKSKNFLIMHDLMPNKPISSKSYKEDN